MVFALSQTHFNDLVAEEQVSDQLLLVVFSVVLLMDLLFVQHFLPSPVGAYVKEWK